MLDFHQSDRRAPGLIVHHPYIDGDLYFDGNFANDYAGTSIGIPEPFTNSMMVMTRCPHHPAGPLWWRSNDRFLTGWEIGEYRRAVRVSRH